MPAAPPPEDEVREAEIQESASSRNTGSRKKAKLRVQEVEGRKVRGPGNQEFIMPMRVVGAQEGKDL